MTIVDSCLLIDDDQDDQEIFLMAIEKVKPGIRCLVANDGVEGLETLSDPSFCPDFIFLDINMPKINGIECLKRIRKLDHLKDCRVIMYSTSSNYELVLECKELGADEFLPKPPAFTLLADSLNNIFTR